MSEGTVEGAGNPEGRPGLEDNRIDGEQDKKSPEDIVSQDTFPRMTILCLKRV